MGLVVDNWHVSVHGQGGGLFEVVSKRHHGQQGVDAATSIADRAGWRTVVSAARSSMTEDEFRAAVASVWPGWAATHLAGARASEYRGVVLAVVDP